MSCCDDPIEPSKVDPCGLIHEQKHHGNLVHDLFIGDPEKVIFKQLNEANTHLRELAALRANYDSVRKHAIGLLGKQRHCSLASKIPPELNYGHRCR
ncbi:MAG: hypothetical protein M0Q44_00840 [Methylobacter sp.]|jgi:hypothetical protein|nr:hypothetical protein [Methylobacter sp.]